jgi:hypothetical protein
MEIAFFCFRCLMKNYMYISVTLKPIMMKTAKLFAICILTLFFSHASHAQSNEKTLLTITIYESYSEEYSKILVLENDKKIEQIRLLGLHSTTLEYNQTEVNKVLIKYRKLGYNLISTVRGSCVMTDGFNAKFPLETMVTTYLFEK